MFQFCYHRLRLMFRFRYNAAIWGALAALPAATLGLLRPPKPVTTIFPQYSKEARQAGTQGTVILFVRVGENGRPERVNLLSKLGFGLDQRAIEAVSQWRFEPGSLDGAPVPAWTTVRVDFRLAGRWFDAEREEHRTKFSLAMAQPTPDWAVIQRLAKLQFAPAQHRWGVALEQGLHRPSDVQAARVYYEAAAERDYAPAMFELGRLDWQAEPESALRLLTGASVLGSLPAQRFLGDRFAAGQGVQRDRERAQRHYRLCATAGDSACRLRLADLLIESGTERARRQASAWRELAGVDPAPGLSPQERASIDAFKRQFELTALASR